jgi:ADP-heptose:LPS heptosyltransferase
MIHVHTLETLLGDSIAQVPFLREISKADTVRLTGRFHRGIPPLMEGMQVVFDPEGSKDGAAITLNVQDALRVCHQTKLHMAQCYFKIHNMPVPEMPFDLALKTEPCDLPPGILVSPFSVSGNPSNKIWPHERWVQVVQEIQRLGLGDRAYVLGAGSDLPAAYVGAGIEPVFDRPLTQVLDLMRKSPLLLTIDTGTGHLAHLGGVRRHVMVYPNCLPGKFAESSLAVHVRGPRPAEITVEQVVAAAREVLGA